MCRYEVWPSTEWPVSEALDAEGMDQVVCGRPRQSLIFQVEMIDVGSATVHPDAT
ncbi:hypothetical protein C8Q70DRAFT_982546 [Cubamyces menziesii]|nr:hypothetical protein C8Q70DRAFT_982546 [Cubamyces menziesii]